jgi:phasin family protein
VLGIQGVLSISEGEAPPRGGDAALTQSGRCGALAQDGQAYEIIGRRFRANRTREERDASMDKTSSPITDIAKMFEQLKLPGVDMGSIVESRRKDIEALAQANLVALKGVVSIADKQAEFLQAVMADVAAKLKAASEGKASSAAAMDLARQSIDKALAAMRHLAETTTKSQSEAIDLINARAKASLEEIRAQLKM